jgi:hypothetical protein
MIRNIIGISPCYMGGHHLANMISTDNQFVKRIQENSYENLEINAHVVEKNLGQLHPELYADITENLQNYLSQSNVINSHLGMFCKFKISGMLDLFPNKKYYLIEFPKNYELDIFFRKRSYKHRDMAYNNFGYYYNEFKNTHHIDIVKSIVGDDILSIPSELIFTNDPKNLIELLNKSLMLDLDYNLIKKLHEKWLNVINNAILDVPDPLNYNDIITGKN